MIGDSSAPPATKARLSEADVAARALALVCILGATCRLSADPDLWGHLRFGLDILRDRALPSVDPYSFTSDVAWVNHEWLSEALTGWAYRSAGIPGLIIAKASVVGLAYALIARGVRHVASPARWMLQFVAVLSTFTISTTFRPQVWTVLAVSLICLTAQWPLRRLLVLWPVIFAVWANLHGGWVVGLGVIGAWSTGVVLDSKDWRLAPRLVGLCVLCLAATLATPYRQELWAFLRSTVGFGRDIVEWRPVWELGPLVLVMWGAAALTAAICIWRTPFSWAAVLPVFLLAASSLKVIRLIGLFGIVVVLLLGRRWRSGRSPFFRPALIIILWLAALIPAAMAVEQQIRCLPIEGPTSPDLIAAGALAASNVSGRVMVPFNWGQYAIWHFSPRLRVSMDGRRETVYSLPRIKQQLALDASNGSIVPFILQERPEFVWLYWPTGAQIATAVGQQYRVDVITDRSAVLTRSDLPVLHSGTAMPACFP